MIHDIECRGCGRPISSQERPDGWCLECLDDNPRLRIAGRRPEIVCLCGSGRFKEAFDKAEFNETLAGKIVLTIGCNTKDIARDVNWEFVKPMLDKLHLRKIELADEVLILNVDGYIGKSTRNELEYAKRMKKTIRFLEPIKDD